MEVLKSRWNVNLMNDGRKNTEMWARWEGCRRRAVRMSFHPSSSSDSPQQIVGSSDAGNDIDACSAEAHATEPSCAAEDDADPDGERLCLTFGHTQDMVPSAGHC